MKETILPKNLQIISFRIKYFQEINSHLTNKNIIVCKNNAKNLMYKNKNINMNIVEENIMYFYLDKDIFNNLIGKIIFQELVEKVYHPKKVNNHLLKYNYLEI
jgi:hypothetical protein